MQKATETTSKKREDVDALHLTLQNLLYEKTHILKEIKRCHLFRSSHDAIEMVPEEQFFAATSEDAKLLVRTLAPFFPLSPFPFLMRL